MIKHSVNDIINDMLPSWIEDGTDYHDVKAITQGGCASGAYMPAVIYSKALETMALCGDDVLEYLSDYGSEIELDLAKDSWAGFACKLLSSAVEFWAHSALAALDDHDCEDCGCSGMELVEDDGTYEPWLVCYCDEEEES